MYISIAADFFKDCVEWYFLPKTEIKPSVQHPEIYIFLILIIFYNLYFKYVYLHT